ncbi:MAG: GFA family protein [Myxococcales bacterium]|nr:MAG: GFA family protein [Myxococcales bacterium]
MPGTTKHQGGCHCGAVRYEVDLDLSQPLTECNCSICGKTGARLAFVPSSQFALRSGEDNLTDYQFHKKHIHHAFCRTCGVRSFAHGATPDGGTMYAVNVRCLDDIDLAATTSQVQPFDGKSL